MADEQLFQYEDSVTGDEVGVRRDYSESGSRSLEDADGLVEETNVLQLDIKLKEGWLKRVEDADKNGGKDEANPGKDEEVIGAIGDSASKLPEISDETRLSELYAEIDVLEKKMKEKKEIAELEAEMCQLSMEEEQLLHVPGILFHEMMSGGEELTLNDYVQFLTASNQ